MEPGVEYGFFDASLITMSPPTFSVIIRTYNRAHVLPRAINSVLRQTYQNYELIIIDDGSTDDTRRCVEKYHDERIRYFRHDKNLGVCCAANSGLDVAQGEYVSFLDSDDEWLPHMLEKVYEKYRSDSDIACVYTWHGFWSGDGAIRQGPHYTLEGNIYQEALAQGYVSPMITLSAKRACFDVIGKFDLDIAIGEDDIVCIKLAKLFKFGLIKEVLAIVNYDAGNQLTSCAAQKASDFHRLCDTLRDDILTRCGRKTLAKHYNRLGVLFLEANEKKKAFKILIKAFGLSYSFKSAVYAILSLLPILFYKKFRDARLRCRNQNPA